MWGKAWSIGEKEKIRKTLDNKKIQQKIMLIHYQKNK